MTRSRVEVSLMLNRRFAAAIVALVATAGCASCAARARPNTSAGSAPVNATSPALPVPIATEKLLPPGVFYLQAGPQGSPPAWVSVWQVSSGRESVLTRGQTGRQVDSFAASTGGIVVSDVASLVADLAKWTRVGPVWLHPAGDPGWNIAGLLPDISTSGAIAYMLPPSGSGPTTVYIRPSWTGPDLVIYRWMHAQGPILPVFGPGGMLAVVPVGQALPKNKPSLVILSRQGTVVREFRTNSASLWGAIWGSQAPAVVLIPENGQSELLFLSGHRELLPAGWKPLAWSPNGRQILMMSTTELGIWHITRPTVVTVVGRITSGFGIFKAEWLRSPAPT